MKPAPFSARLVPEWRLWWRMHSVRLALLAGPAIGWCVANPDRVRAFIAELGLSPQMAGVLVWLITSAVPTIARLLQQVPAAPPPPDGLSDAGWQPAPSSKPPVYWPPKSGDS